VFKIHEVKEIDANGLGRRRGRVPDQGRWRRPSSAHVVSLAFRERRAPTSIRCFTRCSRVAWEGFCMRLHSRRRRLRMGGKQRQP